MSDEQLTISAYREPDRCVLEVKGELDIATVAAFEGAVRGLCERGAGALLVDISEVAFIDSTGLRAVLEVKGICEAAGCELTMTHGSEQVTRVFELTRLIDRLPFRKRAREPSERERTPIDL
jgi:anti-anti-sigma factor